MMLLSADTVEKCKNSSKIKYILKPKKGENLVKNILVVLTMSCKTIDCEKKLFLCEIY